MRALKRLYESNLQSSACTYKLDDLNRIHANAINKMDHIYKDTCRRRNNSMADDTLRLNLNLELQKVYDATEDIITKQNQIYKDVTFNDKWTQFINHINSSTDPGSHIKKYRPDIVIILLLFYSVCYKTYA